jgi:serine/threonine protein kinase
MVQRRLGQVVGGRYRIVRVLGEGGMASVFLALDTATGVEVALKLMHAQAEPRMHTRFFREVRALASLDHPSTVRFLDWGLDGTTPYLVMERLDGKTLHAILRAEGRLAPREAVAIALELAEALTAIHARGLVHRDLTPANVVVLARGSRPRIKLIDFGIAKLAPAAGAERTHALALTAKGTVIGTPPYAAPEQLRAGAVDGRSDVYALGALLYRMLTGKAPHDGGEPLRTACLQLTVAPLPPRAHVPSLPEALEELVLACLAITPDERPRSAAALMATLTRLRRALSPATERPFEVARSLVVLAATGVALGATVACWFL